MADELFTIMDKKYSKIRRENMPVFVVNSVPAKSIEVLALGYMQAWL